MRLCRCVCQSACLSCVCVCMCVTPRRLCSPPADRWPTLGGLLCVADRQQGGGNATAGRRQDGSKLGAARRLVGSTFRELHSNNQRSSSAAVLCAELPFGSLKKPLVLTGCLAVVLIPLQLKIAWLFCSMYVTDLGGAKPGQTNGDDASRAAGTHGGSPLTLLVLRPEGYTHSHTDTQTHRGGTGGSGLWDRGPSGRD